jgi:diguanylate cyclase (GGDEF)-like protein/PAS domain S-box-containing protein
MAVRKTGATKSGARKRVAPARAKRRDAAAEPEASLHGEVLVPVEPLLEPDATTARLLAEIERLRESEERFASTMALAAIGISHVDDDGRFLYVNPQLCAMLGYSEQELLGRTVKEISHPDDLDSTSNLSARLRDGTISSFKVEKRYLRKDGTTMWAGLTVAMKRDREGRKLYDVSIVEDISARKEAEQRVQYLASHDPLTNLPNRATFSELLASACMTARRYGRRFAVLFVDLDRFKVINDTLGHDAGDTVLRETAARLRRCVRGSDIVARLGGDEFVVLLQEAGDASVATRVADNVLAALGRPIEIRGRLSNVGASIGICLHPDGAQEDHAVLTNADIAMYLAKQSGKNTYRVYVNELGALAAERRAIETHLKGALARRELSLRYDAVTNPATHAVVAVEAGIVWTSPELGVVVAEKWLPVAEEAGFIMPINRWALRVACDDAATWQRAGLPPVPVAVSVSRGHVNDDAFADDVREAIEQSGLSPARLEIDVTESVTLGSPERAGAALASVKALGVGIGFAGFGVGRVAFADLKRFPVAVIKVGAERLRGIATDAEKQSYAEGLVALGKALGLTIVATGIVSAVDAELLGMLGCAAVQGPFCGAPVTASACAALLCERSPMPDQRALASS